MSHHCHARGCLVEVAPELLMCRDHWKLVPKRLQVAVWKHYRPGQCDDKAPSEAWHDAADQAIVAVWIREKLLDKEAVRMALDCVHCTGPERHDRGNCACHHAPCMHQ